MGRLIFWTIVCLFLGNMLLHSGVHIQFISSWFGTLPGDFTSKIGETVFYIPLTSSILVSLVLTIILSLICRR